MKTVSSVLKVAVAIASLGIMGNAGYADTTPYPTPSSAVKSSDTTAMPYGAAEAVKLYQAGVSKDVILSFVGNSAYPCHLTADNIIYMQRLGLPPEITQAMIGRDTQLQQQYAAQQSYQPQPMVAPVQSAASPAPVVVTPSAPAPNVTVIGSDYPAYDYGYSYPYYNYPVVIGGGWGWGGWGWGRAGFRGGFGGFHGGGFHGGGFHGGFGGHGGHR